MKENRFTELISGLSDKEFKRLGDFLKSPFFNKSQLINSLYNYIKKYYPLPEKIELSELSYALYGKKSEQNKTLSLIAEFSRFVELYIAQLSIEEDEFYLKINTLKSFSERNLSKNFSTLQKKIPENLPDEFNRDENFYYNNISFELSKFHYRLERNEEKLPDDIENISEHIDYNFILTKLNVLHFLYYYKKSSNMSEADLNFSKEIITFIEDNSKSIKKITRLLSKIFSFDDHIKTEKDEYYYELKTFVFSKMANSLMPCRYLSAHIKYATKNA